MKQRATAAVFYQSISIGSRLPFACLFILLLAYGRSGAQGRYDWRTNVDLLVERADSLSLKSQSMFYLDRIIKVDKTFKNDRTIKETWYYTVSQGKIVIFQVRYLIDSSEYTETFYINNGSLICLEQYESPFFSPTDQVYWGKVLFFDNSALKLNVTVGNRKSQNMLATNAVEALDIFNKRYSELLRNIRPRRMNG